MSKIRDSTFSADHPPSTECLDIQCVVALKAAAAWKLPVERGGLYGSIGHADNSHM
ncbi:MAG TPA: hypothetical protein VN281_15870 [Verrucomicrobiae bacterium]|nr:hypothetical protein [Verrucomicrobiae bacterium]